MSIPRPRWYRPNGVLISTAPTCGISKSGGPLGKFNPVTGLKLQEVDEETGIGVEVIDDQLLDDMVALRGGGTTPTLRFINKAELSMRHVVPIYYDRRYHDEFAEAMNELPLEGFGAATLGELVSSGQITVRGGHGSAPKDLRTGDVPYIKVSDLRAGLVNINPTNRVPLKYAEGVWRSTSSGLQAFDLISPERASKNIGDFCVLMPGQEQIMVTKEVIVMRPGPEANFDSFYLLWAMTLSVVRAQWGRIVFMQTNREDVGKRYLEIEIPVPESADRAKEVSEPFREYFMSIAEGRVNLNEFLKSHSHHFFLGTQLTSDALQKAETEPGQLSDG